MRLDISCACSSIDCARDSPRRRLQRRAVAGQRAGRARDHRQWRAQVVRDRREQRVAQALALRRDARRRRLFAQGRSFPGQRNLSGERLEQVPLLGQQDAPPVRRQHAEHAERPPRAAQRQVDGGRGRQRVGAETGALAMIEDPLRHREVRATERALERDCRPDTAGARASRASARRRSNRRLRRRAGPPRAPCCRCRAFRPVRGSSHTAAPCAARARRRRGSAAARWPSGCRW